MLVQQVYGKTFMSNCIASELLKKGKTVIYQTAPVLLETVIDYKMNKQKNPQDNFYKSVLEADLLIIDDLGTESLNSMKLSELFTIINTRILNLNNKITKTIISTNLNINEIFNNYEERIGSRIAGFAVLAASFIAREAATLKAVSDESTSWYEPS